MNSPLSPSSRSSLSSDYKSHGSGFAAASDSDREREDQLASRFRDHQFKNHHRLSFILWSDNGHHQYHGCHQDDARAQRAAWLRGGKYQSRLQRHIPGLRSSWLSSYLGNIVYEQWSSIMNMLIIIIYSCYREHHHPVVKKDERKMLATPTKLSPTPTVRSAPTPKQAPIGAPALIQT